MLTNEGCVVLVSMLRSWYNSSGKHKPSQDRNKDVYVKLCVLMDGGKSNNIPDAIDNPLNQQEIMARNDFALSRRKITKVEVRTHCARRRSVLNLSPFFVWRDDKNISNVEFRILNPEEMTHPLAFDLPTAEDIIATRESEHLPLDIIAYHSFSQLALNSRVKPMQFTLSTRLRCHRDVSGRIVTEKFIKSHHAKEIAPWFYTNIPWQWKDARRQPKFTTIRSFEEVENDLETCVNEHGTAERIAQIIGCESIENTTEFLENVVLDIIKRRIEENCRDETLLCVNPIIGFVMDNMDYLTHVIGEFDDSLTNVLRDIVSPFQHESGRDDEKMATEAETPMMDDMYNHWRELNEERYSAIQKQVSCTFLDNIDPELRQNDIENVCF